MMGKGLIIGFYDIWVFSQGPYCAFHKHAYSKVQKPPSQLRFSLPSIIITITSNEPWNSEAHKTDRNPPIRYHNPWPFEPVKIKFCFLRGPLRWLTAAKNAIVSWLLNFRIRMFVKSAVRCFDTVFQRLYRYFSITLKVFSFSVPDRYEVFTSNCLWIENVNNYAAPNKFWATQLFWAAR